MANHDVSVGGGIGPSGGVEPPANKPELTVSMWTVRPTFVEAVVYDGTNGEAISEWASFYPPGWLPAGVAPGDAFVRDTSGNVEHVAEGVIDARFDRAVPDPVALTDLELTALGAVFVTTDTEAQACESFGRGGTVAVFTDEATGEPRGYLPLHADEQAQLVDAVLTVYGDEWTPDDTLAMSIVIGNALVAGHKVWG